MIKPKTKEEIKILQEGGKRLAEILEGLKKQCSVGTSVGDIEKKAIGLMESEDSAAFYEYQPSGALRPYPAHVCVSVNDEIVHGIPTEGDYVLQDGDVVTLDMGLTHKDLITDSAITFVVGESNDTKDELITTCRQALMAGIEAAVPDARVGDISAAVESAVGDKFSIFSNLVGHGVGYTVHEDPIIPNVGRAGTGKKIPEGSVVAIEPMIGVGGKNITQDDDGYTYRTADGSLSAHFEHTVAVTADGPLILTTSG